LPCTDGAPAKKPRRNVRELTTSGPPPEKFAGENRSRPNREDSVRKMDAYLIFREHSLLPAKNSLFPEIFSLLIFAGNLPRSGCGTGVFRSEIASKSVEIAKFLVNFPVSIAQTDTNRSPPGAFLRGFPATHFLDFGLCGRSRIFVAIFDALSLHPKIPFPATGIEPEVRPQLPPAIPTFGAP